MTDQPKKQEPKEPTTEQVNEKLFEIVNDQKKKLEEYSSRIELLEKVADKQKIQKLEGTFKDSGTVVKISVKKNEPDKIVKSWSNTQDIVIPDKRNLVEKQIIEVTYFDETKESFEYKDFILAFTKVPVKIDKDKSSYDPTGAPKEFVFTYEGKEYTINHKFIN